MKRRPSGFVTVIGGREASKCGLRWRAERCDIGCAVLALLRRAIPSSAPLHRSSPKATLGRRGGAVPSCAQAERRFERAIFQKSPLINRSLKVELHPLLYPSL
jgi:hypothetical protein